jgi:hypothetical protein
MIAFQSDRDREAGYGTGRIGLVNDETISNWPSGRSFPR